MKSVCRERRTTRVTAATETGIAKPLYGRRNQTVTGPADRR